MEDNDILTVEDCAVILSVRQHQVRKYIKEGLLKAHKLGGYSNSRYRIWYHDLKEFINNG